MQKYACREYLEGSENPKLPEKRIPSVHWLNARITPLTGWKTLRTRVRYSDAVQWYSHFAKKEFLITDYVRRREKLDFTPEPDVFHDVYGYLPHFTLPRYIEIQEMFAPAFYKAKANDQRENIMHLAWFITEFILIHQTGEVKLFGTGLISAKGARKHFLAASTPELPFKAETIFGFDRAILS